MVNFSLLIRSNFTFYMANSTFYMIKSTFCIVNFEPFQNALRPITNKLAAYTPSRERNEYRLFATETIQLLTADIGNNEDFTDAASILNLSLIKVRNLID